MREPRRRQHRGPGAQALAALQVERRLAEQTLRQRPDVEARAADDEGLAPFSPDAGEPDGRVSREPPGAVARPRFDQIDPDVGDAGQERRVGLRRADIETAVHLPRVGRDHGDRLAFGPRGCDGGLADARGAGDDRDERPGGHAQSEECGVRNAE